MYLLNAKKSKKTKKGKVKKVVVARKKAKKVYKTKKVYKARKKSTTRGVRRRRTSKRSTRRVSVAGGRQVMLTVRNPRRRRSGGGGGRGMLGLGNIQGQIKSLFSKDNLTVAAGGLAATVVTQYVLNYKKKDGTSVLPLPAGPDARKAATVAYAIGIPFVGALVTRRFSPGLSRGMLLGGLINGLTAAFQQYFPTQYASATGIASTKLYLDSASTASLGSAGYMPTNRTSGLGMTFGPGFSKAF